MSGLFVLAIFALVISFEMKRVHYISFLAILAFLLPSCGPRKAPGPGTEATTDTAAANIELYLTSRESTDSTLCNNAAMLETDCGIEDFYFTLKGNVLQRMYCKDEEEIAWMTGKYRVGDSGLICQMDKVYLLSLSKTGDTTNYDRGRFMELSSKEPFMLQKSSCAGISFIKHYNEQQRLYAQKNGRSSVYGRIYFEQKDHEAQMLAELRKVKALSGL